MSPQTAPPKGSLFTLVAFVRNPLMIKVIFAMINIHHFLHFDASSFATSVRPTIKLDSLIKNTFPCSYCSRFKVMEKIMNICVLFQYKNFRNRYQYFFRYQFFSKPIPILFSVPNFFETDTDTFFETKFFRNRYRYFFRYQNFSKPIPIPSKNWKSFETEKFRNRNVTLC